MYNFFLTDQNLGNYGEENLQLAKYKYFHLVLLLNAAPGNLSL